MEILGPYPNTSPPRASAFTSCAYIRVQSDGLWRIYCSASMERRLGILGPGILGNPTNIESATDH